MKQGLTTENLSWLISLTEQATKKTSDEEKLRKLKNISEILSEMKDVSPTISITPNDIKEVGVLLERLKMLNEEYASMSDISDLNRYDLIKKAVSVTLGSLLTYKEIFGKEVAYLEDYIKKELRTKIVQEIQLSQRDVNNKIMSFTQADKMVEIDDRYINAKNQLRTIAGISDSIEDKYKFYMTMWQMVLQSVSTANKERNSMQSE